MIKSLIGILTVLFCQSLFAISISMQDNSEVQLTLAAQNYNRLLVKEDKIIEAVFPPNAMAIKRDEQDGSVYILLNTTSPFTLFLTTEKGRHVSLTLSAEEALGKTIELIPKGVVGAKINSMAAKKPSPIPSREEPILRFLKHLQNHEPLPSVTIQKRRGQAIRGQHGFSVIPQEIWLGEQLKGEILELYNGGKTPVTLSQTWFAKEDTVGIAFSKPYLAPHEYATLYRVSEVVHG